MEKLLNISKTALSLLKSGGADNAFCVACSSTLHEFNVDNGRFSLYRTLYNNHLLLTALLGGKKGSVSAGSFEKADVESLCNDCIAAAEAGKPDDAHTIASENKKAEFVLGSPQYDEIKMFDRSKELLEDISARYPLITIEQMIISHTKSDIVYADFSGTVYKQTVGSYKVGLMYSAHDGDKTSSFFGSEVECDNLDKPFISLGRIADELAEVQRQIETKPVNGKFVGTVIFTPSVFAEIIDNCLSYFASGSALLEGTSPWKDMLDKQVATSLLNIAVAPKDPRIISGSRISGEGFLNDDFTFIEKGVLKCFVMSHYFAKKLGMEASANTENNYVVQGGNKPIAEIIKGIDKGIWIGRLSGGRPASNGDFSAVAKNSFLIENGEIKGSISETMINGNLRDVLMNICNISEETVIDGNNVLPFAAVEGIVVSGK